MATQVARNNVPLIAPINTLPPEILLDIFHLVLTLRPCTIDHLAQVCSRWWSIALGACSLWTQIEYNPPLSTNVNSGLATLQSDLLDRVKLHLYRSAHSPLQLYFTMGNKKYEWYSDSARSLFESVKGRMQSLQISLAHLDYGPAARGGQERLVSALLLNCNRDTFTQLVVSSPDCGFITPSNRRSTHSILRLDLTPEQLDNAFASIRVLHLRNLFPEWTSTAYHNLVDLRLMGSCKINESVLVTILKMSPCLRIFHLGIPINRWDIPAMDSTVELIDLEILRVVGDGMSIPMFQEKVEHLLSLISPGKKALRLFLEYQTRWHLEVLRNPFPVKHTRAFIQRANVVELHAERYPLAIVLASWPIMRHVVLHQCIIRNTITLSGDINHNSPFPQSPLEALYLSNCSIPLDGLRSNLQRPVERLVLGEQIITELSAVCPMVVFVDEMPVCVSSWINGVAKDFSVLGV